MDNFTYILANPDKKIASVIDPGWSGQSVDQILDQANKDDLTIRYIILTHCHYDHVGGVDELRAATGATVIAHENVTQTVNRNLCHVDQYIHDGEILDLGGLRLEVIHTPGHTPDCVCYYTNNKLFTGDTLFVGGCGRADLPGNDPVAFFDSLFNRILSLPDDTEIYPGHHYGPRPVSTIADEKKENRFLQTKSLDRFLSLRLA